MKLKRLPFAEHEGEVREGCVFTREIMLPSRLGWHAYRLLSSCASLAKHATQAGRATDGLELIEWAWYDAWRAIADRVQLRISVEATR